MKLNLNTCILITVYVLKDTKIINVILFFLKIRPHYNNHIHNYYHSLKKAKTYDFCTYHLIMIRVLVHGSKYYSYHFHVYFTHSNYLKYLIYNLNFNFITSIEAAVY